MDKQNISNINMFYLISSDSLQSQIINRRSCNHEVIAGVRHRHYCDVKLHYKRQLSTGEASL